MVRWGMLYHNSQWHRRDIRKNVVTTDLWGEPVNIQLLISHEDIKTEALNWLNHNSYSLVIHMGFLRN